MNVESAPEEVLWKLTDEDIFPLLRDLFKAREGDTREHGVDKETFLQIITQLLGDETSESLILELFNKINAQGQGENSAGSLITWDDFLDFNLKALQPQCENPWQLGNIHYEQPKECKRDSIVKIVLLETHMYFSYAILTKYGRISLLDAEFRHLHSYQAIMSREDQFRSAKEARKRHRWLTDAVFMPDVHMFVVANSTRSMTIYDASGLKHVALWHISGFPHIIQTIAYSASAKSAHKSQKSLILGMDSGDIAMMTFLKPKDELLMKKHQDKMSLYYFLELGEFKDHLQYKTLGKFHSQAVVSLQLLDRKSVVTCSRDDKKSIVVVDIETAHVSHCISTKMGINCFTSSCAQKLLISGSDDGVVRIYSLLKRLPKPKVKSIKNRQHSKDSKPLETIHIGNTGIVDIAILDILNVFICCSRNAEIKFYDMKDFKNLQNVKLDFECFDIFKIRTPEWGAKCIFPGPKRTEMTQLWERNCFLVTCCNGYATIDLFYMDGHERHLHGDLLQPQPLQNSVLIPQDWECADGFNETTRFNSDAIAHELNEDFDVLLKDLLNLYVTSKKKSDIHSKIALLEERKIKMKWSVEHCAPFLALQLYDVDEVQLSSGLPMVDNKKTKSIVEQARKLLENAASQTVVFSDISSTQASRSSSKDSKNSNCSGGLSRMSSNSSILEYE